MERAAAIPPTVEPESHKFGLREGYMKYAQRVTGNPDLQFEKLYRQASQNEWSAQRLDKAVLAEAINSGEQKPQQFLAQSPYVQYQLNEKQVSHNSMIQYARAIVSETITSFRTQNSLKRSTMTALDRD